MMNSIELIEVRLSHSKVQEFENELELMINETGRGQVVHSMKAYSKNHFKYDYLVIIFHKEELVDNRGSVTGQRMEVAFSSYGMVNRSLWNELNIQSGGSEKITLLNHSRG